MLKNHKLFTLINAQQYYEAGGIYTVTQQLYEHAIRFIRNQNTRESNDFLHSIGEDTFDEFCAKISKRRELDPVVVEI